MFDFIHHTTNITALAKLRRKLQQSFLAAITALKRCGQSEMSQKRILKTYQAWNEPT